MSESPDNKAAWRTAYDYYVDCLTTTTSKGVQPLATYKARMKKIQAATSDELTVCLMMAVYDYLEMKEKREELERSEKN